jgi:hypothetical protein
MNFFKEEAYALRTGSIVIFSVSFFAPEKIKKKRKDAP